MHIKSFLSLVFTLLFVQALVIEAQVLRPASWDYDISSAELIQGEEYDLIFQVQVDQDWYVYSNDFDPELGPMLTTFTFEAHPSFELIGKPRPINPKTKYDEIWDGEVSYFEGIGEFRQKIKVTGENLRVQGEIEFQVCTDIDGKCITVEEDFSIRKKVSAQKKSSPKNEEAEASTTQVTEAPADDEEEKGQKEASESVEPKDSTPAETEVAAPPLDQEEIKEEKPAGGLQGMGIWGFIVLAFITGLAALLTPCVFPMIPMTVTFFMKDEGGKKAIRNGVLFGLSIIVIYTLLGTLFAVFFGPEGLNALATHWLPNLFAFVIFIVFALSFLGMFEIVLPSSWVSKVDRQADRGGIIGIFFMAFTLALVSFSCTVPIVGSILVLSAGGELVRPIFGMLSYSLAFALPFTLFAIFPGWLKALPKSGGWLNSVKVVLGFLELALALKFLSLADQAYHWGLLDRDVFITLWVVIFALLGFYLLGKIRLPHDSPLETISVPRLILAIATFSFVIYLMPGLFGAPLKGLSGYLPPLATQDFNLYTTFSQPYDSDQEICEEPKYADFLHFPHGLKGYFDYQQALACAREQNKPLFIDFTGHGCVNCREMEARVWSDPGVLKKLREDFVLVALYVDEKTTLPEEEWYTSPTDNKVKKSIGRQNSDFQISRYQNNAQPYYVILDHDENVIIEPIAYERNISVFKAFLDEALLRFHNKTASTAQD